ncbi:hypothetical protein PspLS_11045 [Pyricularia sp. CBS 133598]|nr:hypothetical protein PspLS_11045 [Pyricularia sp. CBS 133598]
MSAHPSQQHIAASNKDPRSPGSIVTRNEENPPILIMPFGARERENIIGILNAVAQDVRERPNFVELPWGEKQDRHVRQRERFIIVKLLHYILNHKTVEHQIQVEQQKAQRREEKTRDRLRARAIRRVAEVRQCLNGLMADIDSLTHTPLESTFDFGDLESEVNRFRRLARKISPIAMVRDVRDAQAEKMYFASLVISLEKRHLISSALVPDPSEAVSDPGPAKIASPHIYRITWPQMESPLLPQPIKVHVKLEDRSETAEMADLGGTEADAAKRPSIVLEIGHIAIEHIESYKDRFQAPITATGLGLFVDLCDPNKGVWLIRNNDYIGIMGDEQAFPSPGLQAFLKRYKIDKNCGNFKLSEQWQSWNSLTANMQIQVLQNLSDNPSPKRHLVPKFETFLRSHV